MYQPCRQGPSATMLYIYQYYCYLKDISDSSLVDITMFLMMQRGDDKEWDAVGFDVWAMFFSWL